MKLQQSNIWQDADVLDYICITTNAKVKKTGELVMGRGVAKEAKEHEPMLPQLFGSMLLEHGCADKLYGLLIHGKYIAFQTKIDWQEDSHIDYVKESTRQLIEFANANPNAKIGLPFPAINNGKLEPIEVYPIISELPDNVIVYHLKDLNLIGESEILPEADGIRHINIYSAGKTPLGRKLSNMYSIKFKHNEIEFSSVEQAWHYYKFIGTGKHDAANEIMGINNAYLLKKMAKGYNSHAEFEYVQTKEFKRIIYDVIRVRLNEDSQLRNMIIESNLPFKHYYVMKGKVIDESAKYDWLLKIFEFIRARLKEKCL